MNGERADTLATEDNMSTKAYAIFWSLLILAAIITYLFGAFTGFVPVAFGFGAIALTFMGMISVIPVWVSHPNEPKAPQPAKPAAQTKEKKARARTFSHAQMRNSPVH